MSGFSLLATLLAAAPPDQADAAVDVLRLSWLLLGLTGMGVLGVILLAVFRRAYLRSQRAPRSVDDGPRAASSDAWSESGKRLRVEPPRPQTDPEAES